MSKYGESLLKVPFAHRGLHNERVDENSLPSFSLAIEQGYGIELDVHVTKDNQVVVIHDETTLRTMGVDKVILDTPYEELKQLTLLKTKTRLPLLSEVLALVNGKVPLLIELKAKGEVPPLLVDSVLKSIETYPYKETLILQSFNPYVVKALKTKQKAVIVGQLMSDVLEGQSKMVHFMYRSLLVLKISKPDFISYDVAYIHKRCIQRKRRKLPLITWTINNQPLLTTAKKLADNYIFESINIKE